MDGNEEYFELETYEDSERHEDGDGHATVESIDDSVVMTLHLLAQASFQTELRKESQNIARHSSQSKCSLIIA